MILNHIKKHFVQQQIPGFIREEYPLFTEFISQYYDFLDQETGKIIAVKVKENGQNYNPISLWVPSTTYIKHTRVAFGGHVYLVANTGVTSNTSPSHTSGTVTNGTIELTYIGIGAPTSVSVSFKIRDPLTGQFINDPRTGSNAAAAYARLEAGSVDKIIVTQFGSGYTEDDDVQVVISGGGGSGAILEAITTTKLGNINSAVTQTLYSRDVDQAIPEFISLLRKELIPDIPLKLFRDNNVVDYNEVDVVKFIKFIKQFYKSKGAEKSIEFLFRILFNSDVSIYYPKTDILRVSDGKWTIDKVIRISPAESNISAEHFRERYLGERIIGEISGVTAIIQDADSIAIAGGGTVFELKLSDVNGTFYPTGEQFQVFKLDNTVEIEVGTTKPCIQQLVIEDGGIGYQVGDQIIFDNSFLAKVASVGLLGVITSYTIENFGFDYPSEPTSFTTTGGSGAAFRGVLGIFLTYKGYYIGTDGQPSSAKKIQDSEYYQDFSYEIVSDQSANVFGQLLNKTIHPAGLKLFSKILSVRAESLYNDRLNFNPSYDSYTYTVANDETARRDFDISTLLNNGTEFLSGLSVAEGLIIFVRFSGTDYLFEVIQPGLLGNTLPAIVDGNQTSGTATLLFRNVADRPLNVYVDGELKILNVDYILFDANTIRFNYFLSPGEIVRILVRPDNLFSTDYNEYIKSYARILIRKNLTLREPLILSMWYSGLPSAPITWQPETSYTTNDIIQEQQNYYLVTSATGVSGTKAPLFLDRGEYSNGELSLKLFSYYRGYIGDIIYHDTNFYKVIATTNANISGIFGQTAPVHTSGSVINGTLVLEYHDPGFSFWEASKVVVAGDVLYYNNQLYEVITGGTLGLTPPPEVLIGSILNGTVRLVALNFNYQAQTTIQHVSQLDPGKSMLGPTVNDITRNSYSEIPQFFQDIPGTQSVVANSVLTQFDLGEAGLSREDDEYIHYTLIITIGNGTSAGNRLVRTVIDYEGLTKTVTLSSSITIPSDCTSVQYRLLQNYRIGSYNAGNGTIGLSEYDLAYQLNALVKTEFIIDAAADTETVIDAIYINQHNIPDYTRLTYFANGETEITGLVSGTTYFTKAVNASYIHLYATYSDASANNYILLDAPGTGQQFLYCQNDLYSNFSLIITSGAGIDNVLKILEYDVLTNTIKVANLPTIPLVPDESTYYVYPDLYSNDTMDEAANKNYYKSSVISIIISSGGLNYEIGDTVLFTGGYGAGAAATITTISPAGKILSVTLNNGGAGYIYTPRVTVNSVNGTGSSIYAIINPIAAVDVGSSYKYSIYGHYAFTLASDYYPAPKFEYNETIQQGTNRADVIKYDSFKKILYLKTDVESDEFNYTENLFRVRTNTTIPIVSGSSFHSGWQSTNIPVGSTIRSRSYKFATNSINLGSFLNEFGELTYMTTFSNLTTSPTAVDVNSLTSYRTVKYLIQASYNGFHQFSEIVLLHNGTIVDIIEHSVTHTSVAPLVTFTADLNAGNIRLLAAAVAGSTTNLVIYKCLIVV